MCGLTRGLRVRYWLSIATNDPLAFKEVAVLFEGKIPVQVDRSKGIMLLKNLAFLGKPLRLVLRHRAAFERDEVDNHTLLPRALVPFDRLQRTADLRWRPWRYGWDG